MMLRRQYRTLPLLVLSLSLLALGVLAADAGSTTIDLSWTDCSPITIDLYPSAAGPVSMTASCIGQSVPQVGFEIAVLIGDDQDLVPDAWRFDAAGCNPIGILTTVQPGPALAKSCPAFLDGAVQRYTQTFLGPPPPVLFLPPTLLFTQLDCTYSLPPSTPNPNQRYFLCKFVFDHTTSVVGAGQPGVSCGGLERTMFLKLYTPRTIWLAATGVETSFDVGNGTVVYHGSSISPTPARASSWGRIKVQYR